MAEAVVYGDSPLAQYLSDTGTEEELIQDYDSPTFEDAVQGGEFEEGGNRNVAVRAEDGDGVVGLRGHEGGDAKARAEEKEGGGIASLLKRISKTAGQVISSSSSTYSHSPTTSSSSPQAHAPTTTTAMGLVPASSATVLEESFADRLRYIICTSFLLSPDLDVGSYELSHVDDVTGVDVDVGAGVRAGSYSDESEYGRRGKISGGTRPVGEGVRLTLSKLVTSVLRFVGLEKFWWSRPGLLGLVILVMRFIYKAVPSIVSVTFLLGLPLVLLLTSRRVRSGLLDGDRNLASTSPIRSQERVEVGKMEGTKGGKEVRGEEDGSRKLTVPEVHAKILDSTERLISNAQRFDVSVQRALGAVKDVEAVSRGFGVSAPLASISRVETSNFPFQAQEIPPSPSPSSQPANLANEPHVLSLTHKPKAPSPLGSPVFPPPPHPPSGSPYSDATATKDNKRSSLGMGPVRRRAQSLRVALYETISDAREGCLKGTESLRDSVPVKGDGEVGDGTKRSTMTTTPEHLAILMEMYGVGPRADVSPVEAEEAELKRQRSKLQIEELKNAAGVGVGGGGSEEDRLRKRSTWAPSSSSSSPNNQSMAFSKSSPTDALNHSDVTLRRSGSAGNRFAGQRNQSPTFASSSTITASSSSNNHQQFSEFVANLPPSIRDGGRGGGATTHGSDPADGNKVNVGRSSGLRLSLGYASDSAVHSSFSSALSSPHHHTKATRSARSSSSQYDYPGVGMGVPSSARFSTFLELPNLYSSTALDRVDASDVGHGVASGGRDPLTLLALMAGCEKVHLERKRFLCHLLALDFSIAGAELNDHMSVSYWDKVDRVVNALADELARLTRNVVERVDEEFGKGTFKGLVSNSVAARKGSNRSSVVSSVALGDADRDRPLSAADRRGWRTSGVSSLGSGSKRNSFGFAPPPLPGQAEAEAAEAFGSKVREMGVCLRSIVAKLHVCEEDFRDRLKERAPPSSSSSLGEQERLELVARHDSIRSDLEALFREWEDSRVLMRTVLQPRGVGGVAGPFDSSSSSSSRRSSREAIPEDVEEDEGIPDLSFSASSTTDPHRTSSVFSSDIATPDSDSPMPHHSQNIASLDEMLQKKLARSHDDDLSNLLLAGASPGSLPPPGEELVFEAIAGKAGQQGGGPGGKMRREERIRLAKEKRDRPVMSDDGHKAGSGLEALQMQGMLGELKDVIQVLKMKRQRQSLHEQRTTIEPR